ncbi:MAG: DUF4345 family protein [Planctomycetota bacterium]
MGRTLLIVLGLINLAWGLFALAQPTEAASWVGLESTTAAATGELRALYGGLFVAFGVTLLVRPQWAGAVAIAYTGIALTRVLSLFLDGFETFTLTALGVEGFLALLLFKAASTHLASAKSEAGRP